MTSKEALKKINQYWADMNLLGKSDIVLSNEDWDEVYKDLERLEILKKYLYYDNKNHFIKMKHIRKSIYNFDYEDLKEWLENDK